MEALLIAVLAGLGFIIAYNTYGHWLGSKVFRLTARHVCPSYDQRDGVDFVPTPTQVVFGHHFTSIAGTGPIVGPAIAIMWGWLPALLWVLLGSIFIGAVHDFGALVVSLRNRGQTVGDIAGRLITPRVRLLFLLIIFFALVIVLAIFGLVIAAVFRMFHTAILPCIIQIPIAVLIGFLIYKKRLPLFVPSAIALALMYLATIYGDVGWFHDINTALASLHTYQWVIILLAYCFVASVLPVWTLLQPRDYINSLQLISALGLVVVGLCAAALMGGPALGDSTRPDLIMVAPMVDFAPQGAPPIFPFLFITIACGAISGFHCLVSSGTTSKQLRRETDAQFVGYGSMLTEGFLAVIVILACGAGISLGTNVMTGNATLTGQAAWGAHYSSWSAAGGLGAKVGAFVTGAGNFLGALGIPAEVGRALMGVLVASFAATTLDTACRLQRYVIQELARTISGASPYEQDSTTRVTRLGLDWIRAFQNPYIATAFAVLTALAVALPPARPVPVGGDIWPMLGSGGMLLWPLFGATNQLLGGLTFLVIAFYLWRRNLPIWFLIPPAILMLILPFIALVMQIFLGDGSAASWLSQGLYMLAFFGLVTIILQVWMVVEAWLLFPKVKGIIEEHAIEPVIEGAPTSGKNQDSPQRGPSATPAC